MDRDLIELILACKGQDLAPDRLDQILARLHGDDAFQQSFVDEIRMLGMLKAVQSAAPRWLRVHEELGWGTGPQPSDRDREDRFMRRIDSILPRRLPGLRSRVAVAVAAGLLVTGLAAVSWRLARRETGPPVVSVGHPPRVTPPTGLAIVVELDDARWEQPPSDGRPSEGTILTPGRLRLGSGRVLLSFFNGVMMTLEGPADVDLIAIDRVFCRRGRLWARVPKGAEGFVVESPRSAIVDLGTEFAINVDADGRSRVMVFEGLAEAVLLDKAGASNRTQLVRKSKAYQLDPRAGRIDETLARREEFVVASQSAGQALILDRGYPDAVMRSRPRGYWRFETVSDGAIPGEVPGSPPLRINGPLVIAGAPQGNRCVEFGPGNPGQSLSTEGLWKLAALPGCAVEFWFQSDLIGYASLVGLYPPLEPQFRYPHSFLVETTARERLLHKPASIRFLHRWHLDPNVGNNIYSERVYVPRRWHHVVAQMSERGMELYFDGVLESVMPLDPDEPTRDCQLVVGRRHHDSLNSLDSRSFVGRLDELAVYDHPLSAGEIGRHFTLASPEVRPR